MMKAFLSESFLLQKVRGTEVLIKVDKHEKMCDRDCIAISSVAPSPYQWRYR